MYTVMQILHVMLKFAHIYIYTEIQIDTRQLAVKKMRARGLDVVSVLSLTLPAVLPSALADEDEEASGHGCIYYGIRAKDLGFSA